jgi:hypothetical protein
MNELNWSTLGEAPFKNPHLVEIHISVIHVSSNTN